MSDFTPAPRLRPRVCIGSLLDIPLGKYHVGIHGDMNLSGGGTNFIGVGGMANTFKTAKVLSEAAIVLARYPESLLRFYDTEMTFSWDRIEQIMSKYTEIDFNEAVETGRIILTSAAEHPGEQWWELVRKSSKDRATNAKKLMRDTPFIDRKGQFIKAFPPEIHILDSISEFTSSAMERKLDDNVIDDSSNNMNAMQGGMIKTRMVSQAPGITVSGGQILIATAHVGREFKLDPYAPNVKDLSFMKNGLEFKYTPKKFTFLSSVTWFILSASPLIHKTSKAALYPREGYKDDAGDTDLQELMLISLRNKHGQAGRVITLLVSQIEGLLPSLSEFHFLKSRKDHFGLTGPEGQHHDYRCVIYPEVAIKRTNAREITRSDRKLARALEITSEMAQIFDYWQNIPQEERFTMEQLYDRLKEMGYDWNLLLDTRGYWTFDHYENKVKPLSTMDLFNMYHSRYIPWWYPDKDKLNVTIYTQGPVYAGSSDNSEE